MPKKYEEMLPYFDPSMAASDVGVTGGGGRAKAESVSAAPSSPTRRLERFSDNSESFPLPSVSVNDSGDRRYSVPHSPSRQATSSSSASESRQHSLEQSLSQSTSPKMPLMKRLMYYFSMTDNNIRDAIAEGQYEHPHGIAYG